MLKSKFCLCELFQVSEASTVKDLDSVPRSANPWPQPGLFLDSCWGSSQKPSKMIKDDILSIETETWVEISSKRSTKTQLISNKNGTAPKPIDDYSDSELTDEELNLKKPQKTSETGTGDKVRRDLVWKNFIRSVRKFYMKSFKAYKDVHFKKFKVNASSTLVHDTLESYWKDTFKDDKMLSNLTIYIFSLIDMNRFLNWKK